MLAKYLTILSIFLAPFFVQANEKIEGLICEDRQSTNVTLLFKEVPQGRTRIEIRGAVLNMLDYMVVQSADVLPVLSGRLEKMDNVELKDTARGATMHFAVKGRDFQNRAKLVLTFTRNDKDFLMSGCHPRFAAAQP